jgi:hypothetical protein
MLYAPNQFAHTAHELVQPVPTRAEKRWERFFMLASFAASAAAMTQADPLVLAFVASEFPAYQRCLVQRREKNEDRNGRIIESMRSKYETLCAKDTALSMHLRKAAKLFRINGTDQRYAPEENELAYAVSRRDPRRGINGLIVIGKLVLTHPHLHLAREEIGAHELGHVAMQHTDKVVALRENLRIGREMLMLTLATSPSLASLLLFNAANVCGNLLALWQSRRFEFAADRMILAAAAKDNNVYRVSDFAKGLRTLESEIRAPKIPAVFRSHPPVEKRIARMTEYARTLGLQ